MMERMFNTPVPQEKPEETKSFNEKIRRSRASRIMAGVFGFASFGQQAMSQSIETIPPSQEDMKQALKNSLEVFEDVKTQEVFSNAFMENRDSTRINKVSTFQWGTLENRVGLNEADTVGREFGGVIEDQSGNNLIGYRQFDYASDSTQEISEKNHKEGLEIYFDEGKDGTVDWLGYFDISQIDRLNLNDWDMNYVRGKVHSDRSKELTSMLSNLKKKFRADVNAAAGGTFDAYRAITSRSMHAEGTGVSWQRVSDLDKEKQNGASLNYRDFLEDLAEKGKASKGK